MSDLIIPKMERQDVIFWANKIKPLIKNNKLRYILSECDYFDESYPWNCEEGQEADDLIEVARIRTLHSLRAGSPYFRRKFICRRS